MTAQMRREVTPGGLISDEADRPAGRTWLAVEGDLVDDLALAVDEDEGVPPLADPDLIWGHRQGAAAIKGAVARRPGRRWRR